MSRTERGQKKRSRKQFARALIIDLVVVIVLALAAAFFFRPVIVKETSMQPTVQPNDYVVTARQAYRFGEVERGDIVVFRSGDKDPSGKDRLLIKRVIGLPGDIISIRGGQLWRNGSALYEGYTWSGKTDGNVYNLVVPEGEIFVMGDHREVSLDSRSFGCVKQSALEGKAVFRLYPFRKIGVI